MSMNVCKMHLCVEQASVAGSKLRFFRPGNRYGQKSSEKFLSTDELEDAQDRYRRACAEANTAVNTELKGLARALQVWVMLLPHVQVCGEGDWWRGTPFRCQRRWGVPRDVCACVGGAGAWRRGGML